LSQPDQLTPWTSEKPLFLAPRARPGNGHGYVNVAIMGMRDEPECVGPAVLDSYAEVNARILTQHLVLEVAQAQERRPALSPQNRLDTIHQRAKHAHVDLSHPIHLVQKAIDKARLREQPVAAVALVRLEGLEALLDGVSIQRLAA
jgi:hypothetical protein